ncbi:MAG: Ppx/GppA phosphatase family protein, partial [Actinomycetota bacterium]
MRVAAIDVGTNTTRLLLVESLGGSYRDLDRRLVFTRLGEGVDSEGLLSDVAIKRTLAAIAEFCAVAGELGATRIRVACTSAVRDASNRDAFLDAASRLVPDSPVDVISGSQEAQLSFAGATSDLEDGNYLVLDIGGGSTEFVLGSASGGVVLRMSLNVGSVRLTERHMLTDPPATEEMLTMEAAIDDSLDQVADAMPDASSAQLVGVAGTVTSLAAMHLGLERYDPKVTHHSILTRQAMSSMYRDLAAMNIEQRLSIP